MEIPFLFYGSRDISLLVVNNKLEGLGRANTQYYFQMWRDIPSHVVYFRNLLQTRDFMSEFQKTPVTSPESDAVRYDYLAQGDVPPGFWLKFTMGVKDINGFIENIVYSLYSEEINTIKTYKILESRLDLEATDFLILLTNISISSDDGKGIFDPKSANVLVDDEDLERREFNEEFFKSYLAFLKALITDDTSNLFRILSLSGISVLPHLIQMNPKVIDELHAIFPELPSYIQYAVVNGLKQESLNSPEFDTIMNKDIVLFNW